jgi:protein-S-isoprenylcysteine O-methyltransferase Ste14
MQIGFIILILATLLILWAQKTSRDLRKVQPVKMEHFCRGPYCYTRSPTHFGLLFLMLGFGTIVNSFFIVICTFAAFIITRFVFLDKEEKILEEKYGTPYLEYKKKVKL